MLPNPRGTRVLRAAVTLASSLVLVLGMAGTASATSAPTTTRVGAGDYVPVPALHLVFTVQPTDAIAGTSISPAVTVALEFSGGTMDTDASATPNITISICANPGGGALSGTQTVTIAAGVATFSNLSIDHSGVDYELCATSGKLYGFNIVAPATSDAFNVVAPALSVIKTPSRDSYDAAGELITYSYSLENTGDTTLTGPFSVTDNPLGEFTCSGDSLDPGETLHCGSQAYTTTQGDLDSDRTITNSAVGEAFWHETPITSDPAIVEVAPDQSPHLTITKTATTKTFTSVGDVIDYSIVLTNDGDVTLANPSVSDPSVSDLKCDSAPSSFAPGASITCTASHTITQQDLTAGSVTNIATGQASFGPDQISSQQAIATVEGTAVAPTVKPTLIVGGATATPGRPVTPPPTNTPSNNSGDGESLPLFALLLCLASGALGLAAAVAQRRRLRS